MRCFILLCLLATFACTTDNTATSSDKNETEVMDLDKALLGTWEITEMRVKAPTYLGGDTAFVQHIKEAEWDKLYGVKPAKTLFTEDGKLKRTHYFNNGQVADVVNGLWRIKGDSLFVIEPNITFTYFPTLEGEKLKLIGKIDYDRDGEADDNYEANYRLVARTF